MEVILKEDLRGLGHKNDTVQVKPGYGRNYLIPKGLAMIANEVNKKIALENIRQAAHKTAKLKGEAQALADKIDRLTIEVTAKAGDNGKIFGSVTATQLAEALKAQRVMVDRRDISFGKPVKELGSHEALIALHKEVTHTLSFRVVAAS